MTGPEPAPALLRLRDLDPRVRRIFIGFGFSALGSGLTMPFLFVYLAEVRGFPTPTVGLIFAWMGLVGLCLSPIGGTLIDRFGPRPVMLSGLVVEASSVVAIGHVEQVWEGFALATVMVAGTIGLWPASTAMLTRLVPLEARERVYGVNFMLLNAGLALLAPSAWSLMLAWTAAWFVAIQARLEEKHLLALHGEAFAEYASRVGRFLPGIGTIAREPS